MTTNDDIGPGSGPRNPRPETPPRVPGSMRRTSTTDIKFPDGIGGTVVVDIRGRDLRTDDSGDAAVVDELELRISFEPWTASIVDVDIVNAPAALRALDGQPTRGLSRRIAELLPEDAARRSLCYSVLEDFGGAQLVSGYAGLRARPIDLVPEHAELAIASQGDACVGWALDGAAIAHLRDSGQHAVPIGPAAPPLENNDAFAWHAYAPLPRGSVRRCRRTDVFPDPADSSALCAEHHLRDTYADVDGEIVMHEYVVAATFDRDRCVESVEVDVRVLPWRECPGAAVSAQRIVGMTLDDLAARVRAELKGPTTCTHLNSTLRTLADVHALAG